MDFEEEFHIIGPVRSRGGSNNHGLEDFHFIEGTPAQFLNQQLTSEQFSTNMENPPPGLVKPTANLNFLSAGSKLRRSLSKKLKRHLAGSYTVLLDSLSKNNFLQKYDGDRSSTSYPKEQHGSQSRIRPKKSVTPVKELMMSTKLLADPFVEETASTTPSPMIQRPVKTKAARNESFDSSISSTVRELIDSAVQKGRERLKMSRRSSCSASASQRNSTTANSERSSTNDLTVIEKEEPSGDTSSTKDQERDDEITTSHEAR